MKLNKAYNIQSVRSLLGKKSRKKNLFPGKISIILKDLNEEPELFQSQTTAIVQKKNWK